MQVKSD